LNLFSTSPKFYTYQKNILAWPHGGRLPAEKASAARATLSWRPCKAIIDNYIARIKRGFHPTQRTQRKERKEHNEMMSLLDRPITADSDDGVRCWHAAKLWQTNAIKYEIIRIKFHLHQS